jgi:thioredoxin 1
MISRRDALGAAFVLGTASLAGAARAEGLFAKYDAASLAKAMKSGRPVVVHVHASWCITCNSQTRVFNELLTEPEFKSFVPIVVNYDTDEDFKTQYKTPNRSTIVLFKNCKELTRLYGVTDKADIRAALLAAAAGKGA